MKLVKTVFILSISLVVDPNYLLKIVLKYHTPYDGILKNAFVTTPSYYGYMRRKASDFFFCFVLSKKEINKTIQIDEEHNLHIQETDNNDPKH